MINVFAAPKFDPLHHIMVNDSVIRVPGRCLAPPPQAKLVTPLMMCSHFVDEDIQYTKNGENGSKLPKRYDKLKYCEESQILLKDKNIRFNGNKAYEIFDY